MCKTYLQSWLDFDTHYGLWDTKRLKNVQKTDFSRHTCVYFDGKLSGYQRLAETVRDQSSSKVVDFIFMDCFNCALQIRTKAEKWKQTYGDILHGYSTKQLYAFTEKIQKLEEEVQTAPSDLAMFKFVLGKIREIIDMQMKSELEIKDLEERYEIMMKYGVIGKQTEEEPDNEGNAEVNIALGLGEKWRDLAILSKTLELRQEDRRKQFLKMTEAISMVPNPDILAGINALASSACFKVGFALAHGNGHDAALRKLKSKNCDMIVLNSITDKGAGFEHTTNRVDFVHGPDRIDSFELKTKEAVASDLANEVQNQLLQRTAPSEQSGR